jgi:hypothetical protein
VKRLVARTDGLGEDGVAQFARAGVNGFVDDIPGMDAPGIVCADSADVLGE